MPKQFTKVPTTRLVLAALDQVGGMVDDYLQFFSDLKRYQSAYARGGRGYVMELKRLQDKAYARQTLSALKRRKFIRVRRLGHKLTVELTETGKRHALELTLRGSPTLPHGTYTLVTFDIPEEARTARRQFRLFLRQSGFTKLQQSVWVSPRDVLRPLAKFIHELKLKRWVNICRATNFIHPPENS